MRTRRSTKVRKGSWKGVKRTTRMKKMRSSQKKTSSVWSISGRAEKPPIWVGSPSPSASRRSLRVSFPGSWRFVSLHTDCLHSHDALPVPSFPTFLLHCVFRSSGWLSSKKMQSSSLILRENSSFTKGRGRPGMWAFSRVYTTCEPMAVRSVPGIVGGSEREMGEGFFALPWWCPRCLKYHSGKFRL